MLHEIKHRQTGTVIYARECASIHECVEHAVLNGVGLYGADLFGAYLAGACLYGAKLRHARLYRADLSSANLVGADLSGADLGAANLSWTILEAATFDNTVLLDGGTDYRGYRFLAWRDGDTIVYRAGCHEWRDPDDWRKHYDPDYYDNSGDPHECLARLEFMRDMALQRWG